MVIGVLSLCYWMMLGSHVPGFQGTLHVKTWWLSTTDAFSQSMLYMVDV